MYLQVGVLYEYIPGLNIENVTLADNISMTLIRGFLCNSTSILKNNGVAILNCRQFSAVPATGCAIFVRDKVYLLHTANLGYVMVLIFDTIGDREDNRFTICE